MIFFLAKGERDACGPGCSEWIAAEEMFERLRPTALHNGSLARVRSGSCVTSAVVSIDGAQLYER